MKLNLDVVSWKFILKESKKMNILHLDVYPDYHGKWVGTTIRKGIEEKYPETKVWELVTPYFEKRNIHFYVNKCGFKIVEFFNKILIL